MGGGITDSVALALNDVAVANPFFAGMLDVFSVLYPQLQDIDFREQATRLEVPVYLTQGPTRPPGGRSRPRSGSRCPTPPLRSSSSSRAPGTGRCGRSPRVLRPDNREGPRRDLTGPVTGLSTV